MEDLMLLGISEQSNASMNEFYDSFKLGPHETILHIHIYITYMCCVYISYVVGYI